MSLNSLYNNESLLLTVVNVDEYGEVLSGVSGETSFYLPAMLVFKAQLLKDPTGKEVQSVGFFDCSPKDFPEGEDIQDKMEQTTVTFRGRRYAIAGLDVKNSIGEIITYRVFIR